ncbi:MAG TPA: YciI family protein [Bauldia sp.]|nr:YciI family protein [Bauldia sp.]
MRFMTMVKSAEGMKFGPPPMALFEAIGKLGADASKAGVFVEMGGLLPSDAGARVTLRNDTINVIDGPFTEAKEVIGGYAVYEVTSKAEAIEWSKRFLELHRRHWPGWEGEVELRQIMGQGEMPPAR